MITKLQPFVPILRLTILLGAIVIATFVILNTIVQPNKENAQLKLNKGLNQNTFDGHEKAHGVQNFPEVHDSDSIGTSNDAAVYNLEHRIEKRTLSNASSSLISNPYASQNEIPNNSHLHQTNISQRSNFDQTSNVNSISSTDIQVPVSTGRQFLNENASFNESIGSAERAELMQKVQAAFDLARVGRTPDAQRELMAIVHQTAVRKDQILSSDRYRVGLSQALLALSELKEIVQMNGEASDFKVLISSHTTPIENSISLNKSQLVVRYQKFITQRFTEINEGLEFGSMALCLLGKLHAEVETRTGADGSALPLFHAAVVSDTKNYWAANEYGVYLAQQGFLENARQMFAISNQAKPNLHATQNLAAISDQQIYPNIMNGAGPVLTASNEDLDSPGNAAQAPFTRR